MSDNLEEEPEGDGESELLILPRRASPERRLFYWFAAVVAFNAASMLWLSVRVDSPEYARGILDFFMHAATGGIIVWFVFRALLLYPFRLLDLLAIVFVLSLGMKAAIDVLSEIEAIRFSGDKVANPDRFNYMFQACLIVGSILMAGAALGLRHCKLRQLENQFSRTLTLVSGMLCFPAAAGIIGFPALIFFDLVRKSVAADTLSLVLLWFVSMAVTALNAANLIRTMALKAEVGAQEKMP